MKKFIIVFFCVFLALGVIFIGTNNSVTPSSNHKESKLSEERSTQIEKLNDDIVTVVEEKEYYNITIQGYMYSYTIYGKEGNVVKTVEKINTRPKIEMMDNMIIRVSVQAGTGIATEATYFYDVENDRFSENFTSVFDYCDGLLVRAKYDKVIICSVFDDSFYQEITGFSNPFSPVAFPFKNIKFINRGNAIEVTYHSGNEYIEVTESFPLTIR